jgi:hypothetical protein
MTESLQPLNIWHKVLEVPLPERGVLILLFVLLIAITFLIGYVGRGVDYYRVVLTHFCGASLPLFFSKITLEDRRLGGLVARTYLG